MPEINRVISKAIPIYGFLKSYNYFIEQIFPNDINSISIAIEQNQNNDDDVIIESMILAYLLEFSKNKSYAFDDFTSTFFNDVSRKYINAIRKSKLKNKDYLIKEAKSQIKIIEEVFKTKKQEDIFNIYNEVRLNGFNRYVKKLIEMSKVSSKTFNELFENKSLRKKAFKQILGIHLPKLHNDIYSLLQRDLGWIFHQWKAYTKTDLPCYGPDGEIRRVGQKFSNGRTSVNVHPNCYCTLIPIIK